MLKAFFTGNLHNGILLTKGKNGKYVRARPRPEQRDAIGKDGLKVYRTAKEISRDNRLRRRNQALIVSRSPSVTNNEIETEGTPLDKQSEEGSDILPQSRGAKPDAEVAQAKTGKTATTSVGKGDPSKPKGAEMAEKMEKPEKEELNKAKFKKEAAQKEPPQKEPPKKKPPKKKPPKKKPPKKKPPTKKPSKMAEPEKDHLKKNEPRKPRPKEADERAGPKKPELKQEEAHEEGFKVAEHKKAQSKKIEAEKKDLKQDDHQKDEPVREGPKKLEFVKEAAKQDKPGKDVAGSKEAQLEKEEPKTGVQAILARLETLKRKSNEALKAAAEKAVSATAATTADSKEVDARKTAAKQDGKGDKDNKLDATKKSGYASLKSSWDWPEKGTNSSSEVSYSSIS